MPSSYNRRKFMNQVTSIGLTSFIHPNINLPDEEIDYSHFKGKNKVGFNLLLWSASVSEAMNPIADKLKQAGYDGVEVAMGALEAKPYAEYGKYLASIGMEVTCCLALDKDHDPISESTATRNKAIDKVKWAIDRANDLGAKVICGPMHSAFSNFRMRPPSADEYKWSAEILFKAGEYAAKTGVIFAVEAINRFECYLCNTAAQLNELIKLVNHPNVRSMYDSFHSNIEDKNLSSAISLLRESVSHVHISENDRGTPGNGHINFDEVFSSLAKINYKGWFTIESFSRNDENFANAINVWRTFSPTWEIVNNGLAMIKKMQAKYRL